jgi:WD40 repeat protein
MELDHSGPITDCAFSPDNQYLAVADANRLVTLYGLPSYEVIYLGKLNKHTRQTFQSPNNVP